MTSALHGKRMSLPYLGEAIGFYQNPYGFAQTHHQRYGEVFRTRFLGKESVVLLSATGHKYVLADNPSNFLWKAGYQLGEDLFEYALFMIDGQLHDRLRKLMTPAFHGKAYAGYLAQMNTVVDLQLSSWGTNGTRPFYPEARQISFTLATTLLTGNDPNIDQQRFQQLFTQLMAGVTSFTRINVPWTAYGHSVQAKRQLVPLLMSLIQARRVTPTEDALGLLVAAQDEEGNRLTDEQLVDLAITLIFAGHDSTASTITWMLIRLLQDPPLFERVRADIGAGDPDQPVTQEDFRAHPLLDSLIKETLRLYPATPIVMRGAKDDCTFEDHRIAAGWRVFLVPGYTQRRPEYFSDPDVFDPDRFSIRNEDVAHPYAYIGFGGGKRNCLGSGIAQLELKTLLMKVLRRFDLHLLPNQNYTPKNLPINRPTSDVVITYQARY